MYDLRIFISGKIRLLNNKKSKKLFPHHNEQFLRFYNLTSTNLILMYQIHDDDLLKNQTTQTTILLL